MALSVRVLVGTFQFYANTEIIAVLTTCKTGRTSVPGPAPQIDELQQPPVATNQQVGRHIHASDFVIRRVFIAVQAVGEESLDGITAITAGGQGNIVQHQQVGDRTHGSGIAIR